MSEIGILTFHRCINYGSYWQARCLVQGLLGMGYDAVLLDHQSDEVNRAEWRCALAPLPAEQSDRSEYVHKARLFFEAFERLPLSRAFSLDDPGTMPGTDLVLVGSDEVWNLWHPWFGGKALFYGEALKARRVASYAASFGNYAASEGLDRYWAERLAAFSAISVRDENSRQLVQSALGDAPPLVLDPCLQFSDEIETTPPPFERSYIAVYGHSFPHWFAERMRAQAEAVGLPLISLGYRNDWADEQWIAAGPEDFAGFIAAAEGVATNFFHGCVFSLLNGKAFACAPSDYRNSKIHDLLGMLGAGDRLLGPEDAAMPLERPLESRLFDRIDALRRQSHAYLRSSLG